MHVFSPLRPALAWLVLLVTPCMARHAQAQADESDPEITSQGESTQEPIAPELIPPKLLSVVEPAFPAQAEAAGLSAGSVLLRVTLDAAGQVTAVEVVESAGHGFDEAALEAARGVRFEPARRNGEPIASRSLLRIDFTRPPPPPPAPPTAQPLPAKSIEVHVRTRTDAERMQRSAEAVHVVETEQAQKRTADLGEVLARIQGVGVQRAGGLGSNTRFSLNGLTDDQIRFFLDGVPLEFAGYPSGTSNVPVNLVERVEIYRGVVPARFGADALGGAVNLVSDQNVRGTHGAASYQTGSFGTHRGTLAARHLHEPSGWFTRVSGFVDRADNDYPMDDTPVADPRGREVLARVYRFHDAYRAEGANVETGFVDRPWADRLLARAFITHDFNEIQHNLIMSRPYGDVSLEETSAGGTLRYEHDFGRGLSVRAVAGYAYRRQRYLDVGVCVYDWFGVCVRPRDPPGERTGRPEDQRYDDHALYGRVNVDWHVGSLHTLRASLSPTFTTRTGDERRQANPDARDALSAERRVAALLSGVEYELDLFGDRLENVAFAKSYLQILRSEDPLPMGGFRRADRDTHRFGAGDALRYAFVDGLYVKASYEYATRLPRPDEIFGDAFPIQPNLGLKPEVSHNVNLGAHVDHPLSRAGNLRGDVNAFLRHADDLIRLNGNDQKSTYENVYGARSLGIEAAAGFTLPGEYLSVDGNVTYVDFRNTSSEGTFGDFEGKRIPNRPYLFANGSARAQLCDVAATNDRLSLDWSTRYVHGFLRGWGIGVDRDSVDAQLLHAIALVYEVTGFRRALSFTGEVQNLTDQKAYDFFGVPRPGRAVYFKVTASL